MNEKELKFVFVLIAAIIVALLPSLAKAENPCKYENFIEPSDISVAGYDDFIDNYWLLFCDQGNEEYRKSVCAPNFSPPPCNPNKAASDLKQKTNPSIDDFKPFLTEVLSRLRYDPRISEDDIQAVKDRWTINVVLRICSDECGLKPKEIQDDKSVKKLNLVLFPTAELNKKTPLEINGNKGWANLKDNLSASVKIVATVPFDLAEFKKDGSGDFHLRFKGSERTPKRCTLLEGSTNQIECDYSLSSTDFIDDDKKIVIEAYTLFAKRLPRADLEKIIADTNGNFLRATNSANQLHFEQTLSKFYKELAKSHISNIVLETDYGKKECFANGAKDEDGDGIRDDCDGDRNGDGIVNHLDKYASAPQTDTKETCIKITDKNGNEIGEKCFTEEKKNPSSAGSSGDNKIYQKLADGWKNNNTSSSGPIFYASDGLVDQAIYEPYTYFGANATSGNTPDSNDLDDDGVTNDKDKCPKTAGNHPSGCVDGDGDSIVDTSDNCPSKYNPSQADSDSDNIGDACDSDTKSISVKSNATGTTNSDSVSSGGGACSLSIEKTNHLKTIFMLIFFPILLILRARLRM